MVDDIQVKFSADTSELGKAQGVISKLGGALKLLAFGALAKESLQLADEVDRLSKRFNVSTDAIQELQYASKQTGVEFNQVASAMAIASRRVNEATAGIGDANKTLSALNLSAKELNALSPDKQFGKIADALNNVSDQGTRGRLAFELFGRSASELNPLLREGSTGLNDLATKAREAGQVLSANTVESLDKVGDQLSTLGTSSVGLAGTLLSILQPALSAIIETINTLFTKISEGLVSTTAKVIKTTQSLKSTIAGYIESSGKALGFDMESRKKAPANISTDLNDANYTPLLSEEELVKKKDPTKALSEEEFDEEIAAIETQNADRVNRYQSNLEDIYALMEEQGIKRQDLTKKQEKLLTETEARARQERLQNLTDSLNYIATLSTSHNRTLASIGKASAIATATMDTYAAATKALNSAVPPFNYILAAGVTAAGLANVAKIASVKGFATGGIAEANQPFIAGERGAEIIAPVNQASRVFNALETSAMLRRAESNVANSGGQPIININASGDMAGLVKSLRFEIEDANRMNI